MFDLSVLKNIDFSNSDNLLFFAIFGILGIIVCAIIFAVLFELFYAVKKAVNKTESVKRIYAEPKNSSGVVNQPMQKYKASAPIMNFDSNPKKTEEKNKDPIKIEKAKEEKNIKDQLEKLKGGPDKGRTDDNGRIVISTAKKSEDVVEKNAASNVPNIKTGDNERIVIPTSKKSEKIVKNSTNTSQPSADKQVVKNVHSLSEKDFVLPGQKNVDNSKISLGKTSVVENDSTIFKGKDSMKMKEAVYKMTRKTAPMIKGGLGGTYTLAERREIAKKISDFKKFGTLLEKKDKSRIYRTLAKDKLRASPSERLKIIRQERFLKNTIGK